MKLDSFSGGRSSQLYDAKFLKELRALIEDDNSKDIIKRIETERDKFISHNEYPSHHLQTTVSFKKAKRFLNILLDMLDKISVKYDGASYEIHLPFLGAKSLLQAINRGANEINHD